MQIVLLIRRALDYIDRMSRDAQWADRFIMQALSEELNINIVIISNNNIRNPVIIGKSGQRSTIYLGHIAELHYVSLHPAEAKASKVKFKKFRNLIQLKLKHVS